MENFFFFLLGEAPGQLEKSSLLSLVQWPRLGASKTGPPTLALLAGLSAPGVSWSQHSMPSQVFVLLGPPSVPPNECCWPPLGGGADSLGDHPTLVDNFSSTDTELWIGRLFQFGPAQPPAHRNPPLHKQLTDSMLPYFYFHFPFPIVITEVILWSF